MFHPFLLHRSPLFQLKRLYIYRDDKREIIATYEGKVKVLVYLLQLNECSKMKGKKKKHETFVDEKISVIITETSYRMEKF